MAFFFSWALQLSFELSCCCIINATALAAATCFGSSTSHAHAQNKLQEACDFNWSSMQSQFPQRAQSCPVCAVLCCKTWRSVGKDIDNWMTVHLKSKKPKRKRTRNRRGNGKETRFRAEDLQSQRQRSNFNYNGQSIWQIAHNLITICLTNLPAKTLSKSLAQSATHPFQYQRPIAKTNEQATSS